MTWYVDTISTKDIPLWQWDDIDAGDWHLINVVKGEFRKGVEDGRAGHKAPVKA